MRYRTRNITLLTLLLVWCSVLAGQNRPSYKVERVPLSSGLFSDIAPVIVRDGIVFSSNRRSSIVRDHVTFEGDRLFDIYYSAISAGGEYSKPKVFSDDINSFLNEGPLCFSPDGKQIFFTRNLETGRRIRRSSAENRIGIFIADRQGDSWTNIRPFEHNNPSYNVGHPSVSSDGARLYFASDMPGGYGGSDIWYSDWTGNGWGPPVNAGSEVNSRFSELYPVYHQTGRLYFSSDRPPLLEGEYGGLNIYFSIIAEGELRGVTMMGEPVNSSSDDFSVTLQPDGQSGYFTSSRRRSDDIYSFSSVVVRRDNCTEQEEDSFCFELWERSAILFDTIPFEYEWDFGDGNFGSGIRVEHCFEGPGTYIVKLNALNLVTREIQHNVATYELAVERIEQPYIIAPDTCRVGERVVFNSYESHLPGFEVETWYWNFDDNTIAEGDYVIKVFNEPGVYSVQLAAISFPDEEGVVQERCVTRTVVVVRDP